MWGVEMIEITNYVDGERRQGYSGSFAAKTTFLEKEYTLPDSSSVDIADALGSAAQAHDQTARLSFQERKEIVQRAAESFVPTKEHLEFVSAATGMPLKYVRDRMIVGAHLLSSLPDICAERYGIRNNEFLRPVGKLGYELLCTAEGPVCAFLPANDPVEAFFLYAHAVLSGQSLVVKPSFAEPLTSTILAEAIMNAGYVRGGINVVHWNTANVARKNLGAELYADSAIRIIMGNAGTLQSLVGERARNVVEYSAGNTASVVFADADLECAAKCIVQSAYGWTIDCVSTKSVVVVGKKTRDDLVERMTRLLSHKKVDHPLHDSTDIGYASAPVVSSIEELINGQVEFGAMKCPMPFGRLSEVQMKPVLCEVSSLNSPLFNRENPYVVSLFVCADERDLVQAMRTLSDGLPARKRMGLGVYSGRDVSEQVSFLKEARAHMIFYNVPTTNLNFALRHQDTFLSDALLVPISVTK